jgi:hypothetical protein
MSNNMIGLRYIVINKSQFIVILIVLLVLSSGINAQFYFGKNKIQYTDFEWRVMITDHFKIYFYTAEEDVAAMAARSAEDAYRELSIKFNHEIKRKIPLIIYSSPSYFSQTNVMPWMVPEGLAGITELVKGRVVVPYHGSYYDFDRVIRHEMVHVFSISKLNLVTLYHSNKDFFYPPLWFMEGIAEFWSRDWGTEADMILKDMALNERLFNLSNVSRLNGTFYLYKIGESLCHFIDSTYGTDKLLMLFENWYKGKNFNQVVELTLGDNLQEISRKWEYSIKKKYYPELGEGGLPEMESDRITNDGFNSKGVPILWDDGEGEREWIVYKANRFGYSGIYMMTIDAGKKKRKTLVKGDRSAEFESLYLLRSGIDANNQGKVVFSSKSKERDVIYIYDLNKGKVIEKYEFPDLIASRSPRFSNNGQQVVFYGVKKSGGSDLYILNLDDGAYKNITNDTYYDIDPVFANDNSEVIFSSDRTQDGQFGHMNLFSINVNTNELTQLTFGPYSDQAPEVSSDGIYFSSTREDDYNLYHLSNEGKLTQQSTYVTGALNPRITPDEKRLIYTGYQKMSFHIYSMDLPEKPKEISQPMATTFNNWKPKHIDGKYRETSIKYDNEYSFDIAQSVVGYNPVYGSIGGFQAAISDVLGNHSIFVLLTNTAETNDELLESFNVGVTYLKRDNRLNWGIGGYHLYDQFFNRVDGFYRERQAGVIGLLSYPISKFHRVEFTTLARFSRRDHIIGFTLRQKFLTSNYLSWVFDNTLWEITGPIEGRRYNLSLGLTTSILDGAMWNRTMSIDLRHYLRLGRYSAFANRLFWYSSAGKEPERVYFGGSWSFRGYGRREFYNRNIIFASNELRFPLIDNLHIGLPIGGLAFRSIRGALFFDVGSAWDDNYDQLIGSYGGGFRISLGYLALLRFDFTRTTDFKTVSKNTDFDFFFGWNF